jgi:DnaJ-class molecular chaperone
VDPYTTLGVNKDATQADIQKAYRRLAKKLHPDLNPGNKTAEDKFKEISAAYDLLSDPDKRARFDRGETDASGCERPRQQYYRDFADQDGWSTYTTNAGFADFGDFAGTFSRRSSAAKAARAAAGGARTSATISTFPFLMPPMAASNPLFCPTAPRSTSTFRWGKGWPDTAFEGKGRPAPTDGPPGDALIEISILPHPYFTRKGDDIYLDLPISLKEAVLGVSQPPRVTPPPLDASIV